jgi:hypothetical protein
MQAFLFVWGRSNPSINLLHEAVPLPRFTRSVVTPEVHPHVPYLFTALSIPYKTFVDYLESL